MNTITKRVLLATVFLVSMFAFVFLPDAWKKPIDSVLPVVFFGLIVVDWIWLRLIKPNWNAKSSSSGEAA